MSIRSTRNSTGFAIPPDSTFGSSNATYLTSTDQASTLANSRWEKAGNGITFDDSVANVRTISSNYKEVTFTFTDAQIKALPTTPIDFGIAPGSGFFNNVRACTYILDTAAGAYTNINATFCALSIINSTLVFGPINDSASTPTLTLFNLIFGVAHKVVYSPAMPYSEAYVSPGFADWVINPVFDTAASLDNKQFRILVDNNGSGNFTGGNAANSLIVRLKYYVEPL